MSSSFPTLLSPLVLKHADGSETILRSRVLMGSMHTGLEEAVGGIERMATFYSERAAGGAALIVTGGLSPNDEGNMWAGMRTMSTPEVANAHRVITTAVQANRDPSSDLSPSHQEPVERRTANLTRSI
ncbi:hypothetical protein ACF1BQ_019615 [Bradyrhizobium sp. RDT10]